MSGAPEAPVDLLARTAALVTVASPSRAEGPLVEIIEDQLRVLPHLDVTRVGENLVARTNLGRPERLILAGHTDTVPANGNAEARIEAGCQGTMRLRVVLRGERAHTARPWMGRNAVHRLAGLLSVLDSYTERRPVIDGCEFREALQAVAVEGGVAGNVVPDEVVLTLNHRFAPDRDLAQAEGHVREVLAPFLEPDDVVEVVDAAPAAAPGLSHPLLAAVTSLSGGVISAKLGWTDVARFAAHGVPAVNFGPGDSTIAHTAHEHLDRAPLERVWAVLETLLREGPDAGRG